MGKNNEIETSVQEQELAVVTATTTEETIPGFSIDIENGQYVKFRYVDTAGSVIDTEGTIGISCNGYLEMRVDYEGYMQAQGLNPETAAGCEFKLTAKTRPIFPAVNIYSIETGDLLLTITDNQMSGEFYIPLNVLYKQYGTTDIKLAFVSETLEYQPMAIPLCGFSLVYDLQVTVAGNALNCRLGKDVDVSGLVVERVYDTNCKEQITDFSYLPQAITSLDETELMVSDGKKTASVAINVIDYVLRVNVESSKYYVGDTIVLTAERVYNDGEVNAITDFVYSPSVISSLNDNEILVSDGIKNTSLTISVSEYRLSAVSLLKNEYTQGEKLDPNFLLVERVYNGGVKEQITEFTVSPTTVESGTNEIIVSDGAEEAAISITKQEKNVAMLQEVPVLIEVQECKNYEGMNPVWETVESGFKTIKAHTVNSVRTRTVVKIPRTSIDMGEHERVGVRACFRYNISNTNTTYIEENGYVKVNGEKNYFIPSSTVILPYVGSIRKEDVFDYLEIVFEEGDFSLLMPCQDTITIHLEREWVPETVACQKEISLVGDSCLRMDMFTGKATFSIADISAGSTLLGLGISHEYRFTGEETPYGTSMRLNICERLKPVKNARGKANYLYQNALSQNEYLKDEYLTASGRYLTYSEKSNVEYSDENGYTYDGEPIEYVGYTKNGQKFSAQRPNMVQMLCEQEDCPLSLFDTHYYLLGERYTKSFDSFGCLRMINDSLGNYIVINYQDEERVSCVVDNYGNRLDFVYNDDGRLESVTDSRGRKLVYSYQTNNTTALGMPKYNFLKEIKYYQVTDSGVAAEPYFTKSLGYTRQYINNMYRYDGVNVSTSDGVSCSTVQGNAVNAVTYMINGAEDDSLQFYYGSNVTIVNGKDGKQVIYKFASDEKSYEYYELQNGLVSYAMRYETGLDADGLAFTKTIQASRESLHKNIFSKYTFAEGVSEEIKRTRGEKLQWQKQARIPVMEEVIKSLETEYEYDEHGRLSQTKTEERYSTGVSHMYVTKYWYDDKETTEEITDEDGNVIERTTKTIVSNIRKQLSYVEEEKTTTGMTYVFYTYAENGKLLSAKTYWKKCECEEDCRCEDLEDSETLVGYITERTYNEDGQLVQTEKDPTGQYTTRYFYKSGTKLLSAIRRPDASQETSYTYDARDRLTRVLNSNNYNTIAYENSEVSKMGIPNNDSYLNFVYDDKKRITQIKFGDTVYESISYGEDETYGEYTVDRVNMTNPKGEIFKVLSDVKGAKEWYFYTPAVTTEIPAPVETLLMIKDYDAYGQVVKVTCGTDVENYVYNSLGQLKEAASSKVTERFFYTLQGKIGEVNYTGEVNRCEEYTYEQSTRNTLRRADYTIGDKVIRCLYTYQEDGRVCGESINIGATAVEQKSYQYLTNGIHKTDMVQSVSYGAEDVYEYAYDRHGNLSEIKKNGALQEKYEYDAQDRLIWEASLAFNETYHYSYDGNGDRFQKSIHPLSWTPWTESLKDNIIMNYTDGKLTSVDGQTIEYDAVGNPTSYLGKTLVWSKGRRLMSFDGLAFEYDEQGRRTKKGDIEFVNDHNGRVLKSSDGVQYYYDGSGAVGLLYDGNQYVFRKDIQGNIIAVLDSNGMVVVQYWYDAWGNHKVCDVSGNEITDMTHIGHMNAYRYRGYYYDRETGLYYLNTRYYDPETGRWLNKDDVLVTACLGSSKINGLNSYAYCFNNPVMYVDYGGLFPRKNRAKHNQPSIRVDKYNERGIYDPHIHLKMSDGEQYSWSLLTGETHEPGKYFGLDHLSKTRKKKLIENGVPKEYFDFFTKIESSIPNILAYPIIQRKQEILSLPLPQKNKEDNILWDPKLPSFDGGNIWPSPLPDEKKPGLLPGGGIDSSRGAEIFYTVLLVICCFGSILALA